MHKVPNLRLWSYPKAHDKLCSIYLEGTYVDLNVFCTAIRMLLSIILHPVQLFSKLFMADAEDFEGLESPSKTTYVAGCSADDIIP